MERIHAGRWRPQRRADRIEPRRTTPIQPLASQEVPMHRREWLRKTTAGAGMASLPLLAAVGQGAPLRAAQQPPAAGRNLPPLRILDIRTVLTAPAGIRLV